ncbi:MAG: pitrilysin family protein [Acholeplasmataceae bacterium]|nr:insulinase family protein [Acholeplasmataceae bacterium]
MHFIENNFKTIQFSAFFTAPDDLKVRAYRNVLPNVLTKTNDQFKTKLLLNEHLEHLYGAYFRQKIDKYANQTVISITLTIPDPQIVKDKQLFDQALALFKSTIFDRKSLNEDVFHDEKRNTIELYESLKDRKRQYAQFKFFEHFFDHDNDRVPLVGSLSDVKKMSFDGLMSYYDSVFSHDQIEIIVNGSLDDDMKQKVQNAFPMIKENTYQIKTKSRRLRALKTVRDQIETKQAIIMIGYVLPVFIKESLYEAAMLFDAILGETPESRLFQKIREEKGLCYDVSSSYDGYKGVLIVHSGVSIEQKDEALKAMLELVDDMIKNHITDEELASAKSYVSHMYKSNTDSQSALTRRKFTSLILNDPSTIDDRLARIELVTKEDIKKVMDLLVLDTIYMLEEEHD